MGEGIISSPSETQYALTSKTVERKPFSAENVLDVLRTPYRIDIMQPIYYMLTKVSDLDDIRKYEVEEIMDLVKQAKTLGLFSPTFPPKDTVKVS